MIFFKRFFLKRRKSFPSTKSQSTDIEAFLRKKIYENRLFKEATSIVGTIHL